MAPVEEADAELERRGLEMFLVFGARHHEHFPDGLPWTCTFRYQRRRVTISYYTAPGVERQPTAAEVLTSLLNDADAFKRLPDFLEFCARFGFERDRPRAEWTYRARRDVRARLHYLLGRDYVDLANAIAQSDQ